MFNKQVFNIIGLSWILLGFTMILSSSWSIYYSENDLFPLCISAAITVFFGSILYYVSKNKGNKDKGPTLKEFILFWVIIIGISVLLGWYKGHLIFQL